MSVIEQLEKFANQQPNDVLYEWFERRSDGDIDIKHSFSYGQSWDRVSSLAQHLIHEENLKPNNRVLLCYPPCLDFLFAFLGCILANVIPVPAYPPNPQALKATIPAFARIKHLADARVALTNKTYNRWTKFNLFATWPSNLKWVVTDAVFTARKNPLISSYCSRLNTGDTAFLQFTSGSTGDPKGVMISHKALWESCRGMTACEESRVLSTHQLSSGEKTAVMRDTFAELRFTVVSWLPLYHDFGLIFAALLPIYRGGNSLLCSPLDFIAQPLIWLRALSKFRATASCAPNFAFDLVVRRWKSMPPLQRPSLDLSCMRFIPSGGEAVRAKTMADFANTFKSYGFDKQALCPSYGFAECTVAACAEYSTALIFSKHNPDLISCGSKFDHSGMLIAVLKSGQLEDQSQGKVLTPEMAENGEVGEIVVTGNALSSGYWPMGTAPGKASHSFLPSKVMPSSLQDTAKHHPDIRSEFWFATGDLGFLEDGHLYVTGRIKEVIVIRGRNYIASDIEHTVAASIPEARPGCIAAVGISESNSATEEAIVLCETRSVVAGKEAERIMKQIRSCVLEVHGIDTSVALLEKDSLPKTSSGKLQKLKAREMWRLGSIKYQAFKSASTQCSTNASCEDESSTAMTSSQDLDSDAAVMMGESEESAWDFAATNEERFSAIYIQIRRITKAHLADLESSSTTDLQPETEWHELGLDSLSAVLIMQDLQDEANRVLKEFSTPIVLSPSLLYEHKNVKALIQYLITLRGSPDAATTKQSRESQGRPKNGCEPEVHKKSQVDFEQAFELPQRVSALSYIIFAAAQIVWTCFMWSVMTYATVQVFSLVRTRNVDSTIIIIPLVHFLLLYSLAMATVLLKKTLIGIYRPGCYPQYSEYHLRCWMIESAVNLVGLLGMNYLHNTKAYEVYLRSLGVDISPGTSINTAINTAFDLLTIGPDSMIEHNSTIRSHNYQNGCLFLSRVEIGPLAVVEQRAIIQSSATVWKEPDRMTTNLQSPTGQITFAIPPQTYYQDCHTILRPCNQQPSAQQNDFLYQPTGWKTASQLPILRWIYSIGLFWLTDLAVAFSVSAAFQSTMW